MSERNATGKSAPRQRGRNRYGRAISVACRGLIHPLRLQHGRTCSMALDMNRAELLGQKNQLRSGDAALTDCNRYSSPANRNGFSQ